MKETKRRLFWNPASPLNISPEEYEREVAAWLEQTNRTLHRFEVRHQARIAGSSGEYAFDAVAEFEVLEGARILVLVECKRHVTPVKREAVLALESKLRDVGGHKAMLVATAGFQRGAIEYAAVRGIATVTFIDGRLTYETKGARGDMDPPPWANVPRFAGWFVTVAGGTIKCSLVERSRTDAVAQWLGM